MEAQPLETIPEETPAPTKTRGRVTSDVPKTKPATEKNPGRVASGKRLVERNLLAREAKKQAESAKTQTAATSNSTSKTTTNPTNCATDESSSNLSSLILGVGGLIVSALGVYYRREAIMKTLGRKEPAPTAPPQRRIQCLLLPHHPTTTLVRSRRNEKSGVREMN